MLWVYLSRTSRNQKWKAVFSWGSAFHHSFRMSRYFPKQKFNIWNNQLCTVLCAISGWPRDYAFIYGLTFPIALAPESSQVQTVSTMPGWFAMHEPYGVLQTEPYSIFWTVTGVVKDPPVVSLLTVVTAWSAQPKSSDAKKNNKTAFPMTTSESVYFSAMPLHILCP